MSKLEVNTLAPQTGTTITIGESGDTVALGSGASQTLASNVPAFEATLTANQTVANSGTETKVQFNHEVLDTDNCYDNSTNYRFTPNVAGKYFVTLCVGFEGNSNQNMGEMYGTIFKNGSAYTHYSTNKRYSAISSWTSYTLGLDTRYTSAIIDMNGSTDYLEGYGTCFNGASNFYFNRNQSFFSAYKLIGL